MSSIHGRSVKAIRFFREQPAALSVYWLSCAHRNQEGVAWPSLAGLVRESGWSLNPCTDARTWLVEHGALVRVEGYIRPEWRAWSLKKLKRRLNLDRSEYYRVTGRIVIDGKTYDLLYAPADDAEESSADDVSRHDTSSDDISPKEKQATGRSITSRKIAPTIDRPHDISQGDSELNTTTELDSTKVLELDSTQELDTTTTARDAEEPEPPKGVVVVEDNPESTDSSSVIEANDEIPGQASSVEEQSPSPSSALPLPTQRQADFWMAAFHQLEMQLDRASFETWLRGAELLGVESEDDAAEIFVIAVRNAYARDMLQGRFYRNVRRVLGDVCGKAVELRFEVNPSTDPIVPTAEEEMPLFRILAQQDSVLASKSGPVAAQHEQNGGDSIRELFEHFISPITDANEASVQLLEQHYDAATFGYALTVMAAQQARGVVRDALAYTLGILRKQQEVSP